MLSPLNNISSLIDSSSRSSTTNLTFVPTSEMSKEEMEDEEDCLVYRAVLLNKETLDEKAIPKLCSILLVKCQFSAYSLAKLFEEYCSWDEKFFHVKSCHLFADRKALDTDTTTIKTSKTDEEESRFNSQLLSKRDKEHLKLFRIPISQEKNILDFKKGTFNTLVASKLSLTVLSNSSLPKCNLIINFDPPKTFCESLLIKARTQVASNTDNIARLLYLTDDQQCPNVDPYYEVEQSLINQCIIHDAYHHSTIDNRNFLDQVILDGRHATLKLSSSLNIINMYCARLPSDYHTNLAPKWYFKSGHRHLTNYEDSFRLTLKAYDCGHKEETTLVRCHLRMPINSPLQSEIVSPATHCKALSVYLAAYMACLKLQAIGELDNRFNPKDREKLMPYQGPLIVRTNTSPTSPYWQVPDQVAAGTRPGITCEKRRTTFYKRIPKQFQDACPIIDSNEPRNYLTIIKFHQHKRIPRFRDLLLAKSENFRPIPEGKYQDDPRNFEYAILTSKPCHSLPIFPIFTRFGEERIRLLTIWNPNIMTQSADGEFKADSLLPIRGHPIGADEMDKLKFFHHIIFKSVLRVERSDSMRFNMDHALVPLLMVPIDTRTLNIKWSIIHRVIETYDFKTNCCRIMPRFDVKVSSTITSPRSKQEKQVIGRYCFKEEDFLNSVVMPTYRNLEMPQYYYVLKIKYSATLTETNQPLIEAEYCPKRLNLLLPRHLSSNGNPLVKDPHLIVANNNNKNKGDAGDGTGQPIPQKTDGKKIHVRQLLIPELTFTHPFSSFVWKKTYALPSILYRVLTMSNALELRNYINHEVCSMGSSVIHPQPDRLYRYAELMSDEEDPAIFDSSNVWIFKYPIHQFDEETNDLQISYHVEDDDDDDDSVDSFDRKVTFFPSDDDFDNEDHDVTTTPNDNDQRIISDEPTCEYVLQAITLAGSNDWINYERMETIGDSFLKFIVTIHNFFMYPNAHEGSLSHLRSQVVSNLHLFALAKEKGFGDILITNVFQPNENWLPPGYFASGDDRLPEALRQQLIQEECERIEKAVSKQADPNKIDMFHFSSANIANILGSDHKNATTCAFLQHQVTNKSLADCIESLIGCYLTRRGERSAMLLVQWLGIDCMPPINSPWYNPTGYPWKIPDHISKHKESWLASPRRPSESQIPSQLAHDLAFQMAAEEMHLDQLNINYKFKNIHYLVHAFTHPSYVQQRRVYARHNPQDGSYNFITRPLTLLGQWEDEDLPDADYFELPFTDSECYQRLEFLGDAVLDYLITKFIYEDQSCHNPGIVTDLRSALVNNNIFAALSVKEGFHKFIRMKSIELNDAIIAYTNYQINILDNDLDRIVFIDNSANHEKTKNMCDEDENDPGTGDDPHGRRVKIARESEQMTDSIGHDQLADEMRNLNILPMDPDDENNNKNNKKSTTTTTSGAVDTSKRVTVNEKDVEIPKALGDVFESLVGAVFLDSGLNLNVVWRVFYPIMKERIDKFASNIPKSPVRELMELEPDLTKFDLPTRLLDGRISVRVHIVGCGSFIGVARNYRLAKSLAAKKALRVLYQKIHMEAQLVPNENNYNNHTTET